MLAPEEQQIEICLLKSNLKEIENEMIVQCSSLPALDADNEQKYQETMKALQVVRSLNIEMGKLEQESVQLQAKRMQLKQQCDEISKNLETAYQNREKLMDFLKQEEQEIDDYARKYEDLLQEKADRLRNTRGFYDEAGINAEIDKVNNVIAELKDGISKKQSGVDELRARMDAIHPEVPENLLEEIGKTKLENKIKSLTKQYEELIEKTENRRKIIKW